MSRGRKPLRGTLGGVVMLYTLAPAPPGEHITLYFSPDEAKAAAIDGQSVLGVCVHFDSLMNRLMPIGSLYRGVDRDWTTSAECDPKGHIIVSGPLPQPLLFSWSSAK